MQDADDRALLARSSANLAQFTKNRSGRAGGTMEGKFGVEHRDPTSGIARNNSPRSEGLRPRAPKPTAFSEQPKSNLTSNTCGPAAGRGTASGGIRNLFTIARAQSAGLKL